MHTIIVEVQPRRLVVRIYRLTAKRCREADDSLRATFELIRWNYDLEGYCLPRSCKPELEAWLSEHFEPDAVLWTSAPEPAHEARSA